MLIGAWLLIGTLTLAQTSRVQETITVTASDTKEALGSIHEAERLFVAGNHDAAIRVIDHALERAVGAHARAELYNCRAWLKLKSPHIDLRHPVASRQWADPTSAEPDARRATEIEPTSDYYWRDYAAIRIRRSIQDRTFNASLASVETDAEKTRFTQGSRRSLLKRQAEDLRHALEKSKDVDTLIGDELTDALIRERALDWPHWLMLWHASLEENDQGRHFQSLTERTSGDLRTISMSAFPFMQNGDTQRARQRLHEAHDKNPSAADVLMLMIFADLESLDSRGAMADFRELQRLDSPVAFELHQLGLHTLIRNPHLTPTAAGRVLFLAQGLDLFGAREALLGVTARANKGQKNIIQQEQSSALQQGLADIRRALDALDRKTQIALEKLEIDAKGVKRQIAKLDKDGRSRFNKIQHQVTSTRKTLRLRSEQIDGLAFRLARLQQTTDSRFARIDQRLDHNERLANEIRRKLTRQIEDIIDELNEEKRISVRHTHFFAQHISLLTESVEQLNKWHFGDGARKLRTLVLDMIKTTIATVAPGGAKVGALVTNFLISALENFYDEVMPQNEVGD